MSEWPHQVEVATVGDRGIYFSRFADWCADHKVPFKTYDGLRNDGGIRVAFKTSVCALQFQAEFGGEIVPAAELERAGEDDAFFDDDFRLMTHEIFGEESDEHDAGATRQDGWHGQQWPPAHPAPAPCGRPGQVGEKKHLKPCGFADSRARDHHSHGIALAKK